MALFQSTHLRHLGPLVVFLVIVLVWEAALRLLAVPAYILPSPRAIAVATIVAWQALLSHLAVTMIEAVAGFVLGSLLGVALGILFAKSDTLALSIYPYAILVRSLPVVAVAPLLVLWFGTGLLPKVALATLICFFQPIATTVKGLRSVDQQALRFMASLNATGWQTFTKLEFPTALPVIFPALEINAVLSVVGAIVGEFAAADRGIGYLILVSAYRLKTDLMFAGIVVSSLGGVLFFAIVRAVERRVIRWHVSEI